MKKEVGYRCATVEKLLTQGQLALHFPLSSLTDVDSPPRAYNNNKMEHINDKFLINESNEGTRVLLDKGMPINMTCKIIKNYQRCYICVKEENPQLAQELKFHKYMENLIERKFIEIDLVMTVGSEDLKNYRIINEEITISFIFVFI